MLNLSKKLSAPIVFVCMLLLVLSLSFGLQGCQTKADKQIVAGVEKLEVAVIKISVKNVDLWTKELAKLEAEAANATPEDLPTIKDKIEEAKSMIRANMRLPEVITELRKAIKGEKIE